MEGVRSSFWIILRLRITYFLTSARFPDDRAWEGPFIFKELFAGWVSPPPTCAPALHRFSPQISASVSGHFDEKFSTGCFYKGFRGNGINGVSPVWAGKSIKNPTFLSGHLWLNFFQGICFIERRSHNLITCLQGTLNTFGR